MDTTPPEPGTVKDGLEGEENIVFSSKVAEAIASWKGFRDPESDIQQYVVNILRKSHGKMNSSFRS